MAIDARIPMMTNPQAMAGPDLHQVFSLADMALKLQANRQAVAAQNELRNVFQTPDALDPEGNPTPQAMAKIMAIDPNTGMQLRQNQLKTASEQALLQYRNSQAFQGMMGQAREIADASTQMYDELVKKGVPPDEAKQQVQREIYGPGVAAIKTAGYPPSSIQWIPEGYDPDRVRAFQMSEKDRLVAEAAKTRTEPTLTPMIGSYTDQQGVKHTNEPITFDPKRGVYHDAAGNPITPASMAKVGAATQGETTPTTPEQRQSTAAMVAAGTPLTQAVPGWGTAATNERKQARNDAIDLIRKENPDMSAADAGVELARREVEFMAGKTSVSQLTVMEGATKQAVAQMDFNIDQAQKEMKRLGSVNLSPILNAIARGEEKWTGEPAYSSLFFYLSATANESARILAGGQASRAQLHAGAMEEAQKWVNINMTPDSFNDVAMSMKEEGQARLKTFRDAARAQAPGGGRPPIPDTTPPGAVQAGGTTLPATVVQTLKDGKPHNFANGQTWQLKDGKYIRLPDWK